MKNLISSFVILTLLSSCNRDRKIVSCDLLKQKNKLVYLNDTLYTGFCEIYKDTILIASRSYKEGQRDGKWREYFENGMLRFVGFCENNELHGDYIEYNITGTIIKKGTLRNGFKDGIWEYFSEDGILIKTEFYKNGKTITND